MWRSRPDAAGRAGAGHKLDLKWPGGAGLATSRTLERVKASTRGELHVSPRPSSDLCPTYTLPSPGSQPRPAPGTQPNPAQARSNPNPSPGPAGRELATSRTLDGVKASTRGEFHVSPRLSSDLCPTCALPSPGPRQALSPARPRLPSPSQPCRIWRARAAVCEGVRPTFTPTASRASAFAAAVPEEPDTIAPACPMVLPSGAVNPAT